MVRAFGGNNTRFVRSGVITLWLAMCCSPVSLAQTANDDKVKEQAQPLVELGDKYQNSIKLLSNRFRIDYKVDEITMVFFRDYGSAPIVLVRPDGSKLFQSKADEEGVFWYDDATYDLISIKNPTPGPWQAVGQILPESRVMVISDIQLIADPLPEVLFSGEILKQTARLTNGGKPIDNPEIRDVVELEIKFVSTNNPNFNNFGAEAQTIALFEDNGRGMDERPLDGVFTGQFNLSVANGQWRPVFLVSTPMLSREQVGSPLMLYPNPIKIDMVEDGGGDGYHKLLVDAEREFVEMETLLIDGKVRFPNGDVQNFSLTQQSPDAREYLIVNYEAGVYRIKLTAYGNTKSGRDFILDVPEYSYLVEEPIVEVPEAVVSDTDADNAALPSTVTEDTATPTPLSESVDEDEMAPGLFWGLIIGINSFILIVGVGLMWVYLKPSPTNSPKKPKKASASPGLLQKMRNRFAKKKSNSDSADLE